MTEKRKRGRPKIGEGFTPEKKREYDRDYQRKRRAKAKAIRLETIKGRE